MVEGENSNSEVPKGPDTLGDPTLIEADALLKKLSDKETRQQFRMEDKNLILKAVNASLESVTDKIAEEEAKTPPNYEKLERLADRQKQLTEKRDEMGARADKKADEKQTEIAADLKDSAKEMDKDIVEMKRLQGLQATLTAQLTPELKASQVPTDIAKKKEIYTQLKDIAADLKPLEKKGSLEDQEAIHKARLDEAKKAEAMREAHHMQEILLADAELPDALALAFGETPAAASVDAPKDAPTDKAVDATAKHEGLDDKEKEVILDNKIDQIAFDLAKLLAGNVPDEKDTYGKFSFEAKRGLLMVMSFLGGDPAWVENLTPKQLKDLGMTVTTKVDGEGKTVHNIKWEELDFSLNKVKDVYEVAFGKNGWDKAMGELTPKTTVKDLKDKVALFPEGTTNENEVKMIAFVKALETAGAEPTSGVQDFVIKKSAEIINILDPKKAAATPDATSTEASAEKTAEGLTVEGILKLIEDNDFNNDTKMRDLVKAANPDAVLVEELDTPEKIAAEAKEKVDGFTDATQLKTYTDALMSTVTTSIQLGLNEPLPYNGTFAKAQAEMAKDGDLTEESAQELQTHIGELLLVVQQLNNKTYAEVLVKVKEGSTDEASADVDKVIAALGTTPPSTPEATEK